IMIFSENRCTLFRIMLQPPAWHFFMKEVFAAPASFLPSALTALVAQASVVHFFMNDVLAAPDSALPSLPTALVSQDGSCAIAAEPRAKVARTVATKIRFIGVSPLNRATAH